MKYKFTRSGGVQFEDHDMDDLMNEMFGRTGRRRDRSTDVPHRARVALVERMRRLRGNPVTINDVWDFGRPSAPRRRRDYDHELGLGSSPWHEKTEMVTHQAAARAFHEANYGRSLVSAELVDVLVSMLSGRVVEPFAGMGWLAAHLRYRGIDMLALDNFSVPQQNIWTTVHDRPVDVACADADWIIMAWPPNNVISQRVVMKAKSGAGIIMMCDEGRDADYKRRPTPGFWHHLARSEQDVAAGRALQATQPLWAGLRGTWQVFIKH